ncbi:hypothetical protein F5Y12DRAFT_763184 [Xylaria sp. FL1777]|nr:hypothetical protein F5Y12DRAFT_763184 [Xylaria sp. FL1777]
MPLHDSFLRRTMRIYPAGSYAFSYPMTGARTLGGNSFRFHDGLELPKGSSLNFPCPSG